MVNSEQQTVAQQKGVFRSNCMDCLDRTNVIQSLLARRSLQIQLQVFLTVLLQFKIAYLPNSSFFVNLLLLATKWTPACSTITINTSATSLNKNVYFAIRINS